MASPGQTSPFRFALLTASKTLTAENVRDLAFLCDRIPAARREKITNGVELFTELQGHDLLSENNVSTLIEWMDKLQLAEAVKPLEEYRNSHTTETVAVAQQKCLIHQDQSLKYLCVSCDTKACPECAFQSHKQDTCDVIRADRVSSEVTARSEQLSKEIEGALSNVRVTEGLWEENKKNLMSNPNTTESSDMDNLFAGLREIQHLKTSLEQMRKVHEESNGSSQQELQRIERTEKEIREIRMKIEKQKQLEQKRTLLGVWSKVYNDGSSTLGVTPSSIMVGGTAPTADGLFIIHDERRLNRNVVLGYFNSRDLNEEYWRHAIKVDDQSSPVVMSYINMWYDSSHHVLFAVGKTVYIVRSRRTGSVYDAVESVTPIEIGEVPEGAWITSIATYHPGNDPCDEFLISIHNDKAIRKYRATGGALRVINTGDFVPSNGITCAAYYENMFAIIGRECGDVILLSADGTVQQCGSLRPPSIGMRPVIVLWTGTWWLMLFISEGAVKQWKVVQYHRTGKLMKVCDEGTSSNDLELPVSITRCWGRGYVILANRSIRAFTYRQLPSCSLA